MREVYKRNLDHSLYLISNDPGPFPPDEYSYLMEHQINTDTFNETVGKDTVLSITTTPVTRPAPGRQLLYTDWEGSRIPEFYKLSTRVANVILVPSKFARDAFIASKMDKPVKIVPHGIDTDILKIQQPTGKFTFLCVAANDWRKGLDILVKAFQEEFSPREATLKIRSSASISGKGIEMDRSKIPFSQMSQMYKAHAFVLPTRGEGFCLPALEALGSGLPVIITEGGGHVDFLQDDYYPIKIDSTVLKPNQSLPDYAHIKYYEPSITSLRSQMRYVYDNWDHARQKTLRGTHRVRELYTWSNTLDLIEELL